MRGDGLQSWRPDISMGWCGSGSRGCCLSGGVCAVPTERAEAEAGEGGAGVQRGKRAGGGHGAVKHELPVGQALELAHRCGLLPLRRGGAIALRRGDAHDCQGGVRERNAAVNQLAQAGNFNFLASGEIFERIRRLRSAGGPRRERPRGRHRAQRRHGFRFGEDEERQGAPRVPVGRSMQRGGPLQHAREAATSLRGSNLRLQRSPKRVLGPLERQAPSVEQWI
mmetsp:Transcript_63822/g.185063  ORF Transcript_63822/g.185063 Transcript_63822/m.185063 type:complete len:224 (+) Transcript_63822:425-1096(+)